MTRILILIVSLALTVVSLPKVLASGNLDSADVMQQAESLYLPNQRALQFVSFGFNNTLADLLWFKTISYFGKHYRSDRNYRWLNHMCEMITTLDPGAVHVFEFCGLMLAWEVGDSKLALAMFDKAIASHPQNWRLYYLRGMKYAFFMHDDTRAQQDFETAAHLPGAEPFVARLAAKKLASLGTPEEAVRFLTELEKKASDPSQRAVFSDHLKKTQHEIRIRKLQELVDAHYSASRAYPDHLEELVIAQGGKSYLHDPFGGTYYLDKADGQIKSTSNVSRIKLFSDSTPGKNP